ncbi:MAG: MFS transporter [Chloroflexi bacterium]|nr:MFS transporter [Chloroflexota bacterium]MDA1145399.1 MFS transporter [Chloroflexota bacterium]
MNSVRTRLKFYGWRIVGAGAAIQAMQSGLFMQAFGSYSVLLRDQFGWSTTTLSIAFAMTRAESGMLGPLQGWMIDRFGPRRIMQIGILMMGGGFMLFATLDSLVEFFGFYFLMSLGASLGGFLSVTTALVNWFQRFRSRALAVSQTGFAIGGAMTPLLVFFLESEGWRATAFVSGLIVIGVGMPLTFVIRHRPRDSGEFPDGIDPETQIGDGYEAPEGLTRVDFTAKQALRTRAFWMISLGHASALLVVGALMLHLSLYLTSDAVGMSLQRASFIVGALPVMQLVGQLAGGFYGDQLNKRAIVTLCMAGHMIGLLLLTYQVNTLMIWAFVPFHGLAWGARGPLMQSLRADYFGPTNFGTIMGFSSMIVMLGMISGPLLAGVLRDHFGNYEVGFTILAVMAGLGSIFFILATPPAPPGDVAIEEPRDTEARAAATAAGGGA